MTRTIRKRRKRYSGTSDALSDGRAARQESLPIWCNPEVGVRAEAWVTGYREVAALDRLGALDLPRQKVETHA